MNQKAYWALATAGSLLFLGFYMTTPNSERRQAITSSEARDLDSRGYDATGIAPAATIKQNPQTSTGLNGTAAQPHGTNVIANGSSAEQFIAPENGDGRSVSSTTFATEAGDERLVPRAQNLSEAYEAYVIYEDKCRIKNYDHNDPEILKKFFSKKPTTCPSDAKPFTFIPMMNVSTGRSCIGIDHAVAKQFYGGEVDAWKCVYKEAIRNQRKSIIDLYFYFGEKKPFKPGDCPMEEFIWIECERSTWSRSYQQPLMLPLVKPVRAPIFPNNIGRKPLHVLVVGLDAVSRLNSYRQLPKTLEFLRSKKNLVELFGYNKIEDNSMPNQIPLLTGIPYAAPGLNSRLNKNYFDNATRFLWDYYEERGYRTMFYEEQWTWGLFVFPYNRGFQEVPTTYWPRPLMQAIDESSLKKEGNKWCIGPDLPAKHYLDYTFNTMKILGEERPLFSYSWLSEAAHDEVYGGHRDDKYFLDFFTKLDSSGILNHTAVFFISDHGSRIGDFRKSALGRYEDMLPFGYILMPDSYYEWNPSALKTLRINSKRLVTVYDLHTTLLELADAWSEGRVVRTANGYSLFSEVIPSSRGCQDAGINFQYCSCFESQPYDKGSDLSLSLGKFVIDKLNDLLKKNDASKRCQEWSLDSIEDFVRLSEGNDWTDFYKATIKTNPSAQFEVAAKLRRSDQNWTLLADIDRTDWYSSHSKCAARKTYEKYCYCR